MAKENVIYKNLKMRFSFIIFCFIISCIDFVSADINVIVVDTIGSTINLDKINFGDNILRGQVYTTDPSLQSTNPFPFIIRNIGTQPAKISVWQERAEYPDKGLFDSPDSYIKFWVEPANRYLLPGTIWGIDCLDDANCVNDCLNNGGCFSISCPDSGGCSNQANAKPLPVGQANQVVAIGDLQQLPAGSEAFLKFEIMASMTEPSGPKSAILNIKAVAM